MKTILKSPFPGLPDHRAIVATQPNGGATVTIRDGFQSRDTTAVRIFECASDAFDWATKALNNMAHTSH